MIMMMITMIMSTCLEIFSSLRSVMVNIIRSLSLSARSVKFFASPSLFIIST